MLLGPFAIVSLLLIVAGVSKLRAPSGTATALTALGLPAGAAYLARAVGLFEVVAGGWALAIGDRWSAISLALAYGVFTGVVVALLGRPGVPCGCFGAPDAPASVTGLVCNVVSAAVAGLAAVWPPGALAGWVRARPLQGISLVVVVLVGGWLVHQVYTAMPRLAVYR